MEMNQETIEGIARICHEANRAYCAMIGDHSQQLWEGAPDWQKQSAIDGVRSNLSENRIGPMNASANHDLWMERKLRDGWRYGPVKDAERKEHPCLLPYNSLPDAEKLKDHIFGAICSVFARQERMRISNEAFLSACQPVPVSGAQAKC